MMNEYELINMLDKSILIQSPINKILDEVRFLLVNSREIVIDDNQALNQSTTIENVMSIFKRRESRAINGKSESLGIVESITNLRLFTFNNGDVFCKLIVFDNGYTYLWHYSENEIIACVLVKTNTESSQAEVANVF